MYLASTQHLHDDLRVAVELFDKTVDALKQGSTADGYIEKLESAFFPIGALDTKLNQFAEASVGETAAHDFAMTKIEHDGKLYREHLDSQYRFQKSNVKQRFSVQVYDIKRVCEQMYREYLGISPVQAFNVPSDVENFLEQRSDRPLKNFRPDFEGAVAAVNSQVRRAGSDAVALYAVIAIFLGFTVVFVFDLPLVIGPMATVSIFAFFFLRIRRATNAARQMSDVARKYCEFVRDQFQAAASEVDKARAGNLSRSETEDDTARAKEIERFREVKLSFVSDVNRFDEQLATTAARLGDFVNGWIKGSETKFSPLYTSSGILNERSPQILLRIGDAMTRFADKKEAARDPTEMV